jgi:DNA invertase Pin-like site-specific DNA recombinase
MTEHRLGPGGNGSKIQPYHLTRQAMVYVRQSRPQQVIEHVESRARQYALVERALALGWPAERIVVIDEDQGQSGQSMVTRFGFQRLLAEVGLDHVGLILGLEMSRLARSNKDWHQLLELCALFRTLLADAEGVYDPTDYNDRLLLGLRGMMSEAELHLLKGRLHEARQHKARRGELLNHPPIGYVRRPDGTYQLEPDEQAQGVVRLLFDVFEREGSLHGLLRYLVAHDLRLPVRPHFGANRGQLEWRRPTRMTLQSLLHHPIYAGAYRWGYRKIDSRKQQPGRPGTGRTVVPVDACEVLLKDRLPAYITWERFEAIQQRLAANRATADALGAPRDGAALLGGLLRCGRCGRRLQPIYSGKTSRLRYMCWRGAIDYGTPVCLSLSGAPLDALVAEQVLQMLQPAALELSLAAEHTLQRDREHLETQWQQRLERAGYEAARAARQYQAVEPDNRLVARELERQWEQALRQEQQLQEAYRRFRQAQPPELTAQEREAIQRVAADVPSVWHAPDTTAKERQEIVRIVLQGVTVDIEGASEQGTVTLHWVGGMTSAHLLQRPVARYEQLSTYPVLLQRLHALHQAGQSAAQIAKALHQEGFVPPKRATQFTAQMITRLLRFHPPADAQFPQTSPGGDLVCHEYWLTDLARRLHIPVATLHKWKRDGWVQSRLVPIAGGRVALWADVDELERLRQLHGYTRQWPEPRYPTTLTTPKPRPSANAGGGL